MSLTQQILMNCFVVGKGSLVLNFLYFSKFIGKYFITLVIQNKFLEDEINHVYTPLTTRHLLENRREVPTLENSLPTAHVVPWTT